VGGTGFHQLLISVVWKINLLDENEQARQVRKTPAGLEAGQNQAVVQW
jgi:hypothetical protein